MGNIWEDPSSCLQSMFTFSCLLTVKGYGCIRSVTVSVLISQHIVRKVGNNIVQFMFILFEVYRSYHKLWIIVI